MCSTSCFFCKDTRSTRIDYKLLVKPLCITRWPVSLYQQPIFDSDLKGAWHYNHVAFTPIAKNFMLYCRLIYVLSILSVRLTIKVKVGMPESFKVEWYPPQKTGSSHLNFININAYKFGQPAILANSVKRGVCKMGK